MRGGFLFCAEQDCLFKFLKLQKNLAQPLTSHVGEGQGWGVRGALMGYLNESVRSLISMFGAMRS